MIYPALMDLGNTNLKVTWQSDIDSNSDYATYKHDFRHIFETLIARKIKVILL